MDVFTGRIRSLDDLLTDAKEDAAIEALQKFNNESVDVLTASICGSHGRGVANEDSDIDIHSVHVQENRSEYVKLEDAESTLTRRYSIDTETSIDVEIESWDIQKFASMLSDSNHQAIELIHKQTTLLTGPSDGVKKLRDQIIVPVNYNRLALYHSYRSHAENNYQAYISNHLVSNKDAIYDVVEEANDGYLVESPKTGEELFIPQHAVNMHESNEDKDAILLPTKHVKSTDEGTGKAERKFRTTLTEQNVKRNLAVFENALKARYVINREIPPVNIVDLISRFKRAGELRTDVNLSVKNGTEDVKTKSDEELEFNTYSALKTFEHLVESKQDNKTKHVGDLVSRETVIPTKHPHNMKTKTPPSEVIDDAIDTMINGGDS